jgi:hypothetical protein
MDPRFVLEVGVGRAAHAASPEKMSTLGDVASDVKR